MAGPSGSMKVVIMALFANLGIAIAKFVVALITKSGSMMAESIHSAADTGNQALLIVGHKRASKPPDDLHPIGYGREAYFWALLVAGMLFVVGGAYSLYEGFHKLSHPQPISNGWWAIGVLLFGMVLEGISLLAALRERKRVAGGKKLWDWAKTTGRVNLLVVVFEDLAAQIGMIVALVAVGLSMATGDPVYDAIGSLCIGALLLVVAIMLAMQVRRLIVGFAVPAKIRTSLRSVWKERGFDVLNLIAIWSGPTDIAVVCKLRPHDMSLGVRTLMRTINEGESEIRKRHPEVVLHYVEPDFVD